MTSMDCKYPSALRAVLTSGSSARAPASARSIVRITSLVLVLVLALGSCHGFDEIESSAPSAYPSAECRFMGGPCAPDCSRFYNNGHHREWAICMGVPYK